MKEAPGVSVDCRRASIEAGLELALQSEWFRNSARSQAFLRYVVEAGLNGAADIKERTIGIEVFGRTADYDTSTDSIVRVCARDVRKRLEQFNEQTRPQPWVELRAGSYTPVFHDEPIAECSTAPVLAAETIPMPPAPRSFNWRLWLALPLLALALTAALWLSRPPSSFQRFWAPVMEAPGAVLLCIGHPTVYHLSGRVHDIYKSQLKGKPPVGPYEIKVDPRQISGEDVIAVSNHYVGTGDAFAAAELGAALRVMGKQSNIRLGSLVSFPELRSSPAILLGAYSNKWTMSMANNFRFVFAVANSPKAVVDRQDPSKRWQLPAFGGIEDLKVDYAIVSRVFDSTSGKLLISAAGLTHYGTQVAGELLSRPDLLEAALATCPRNWEKQNLQFVIQTEIIGSTSAWPKVVATHTWPIAPRPSE